MSNSSLICYTALSPNCTHPREGTIDTVAIHCTAGQIGVEALGRLFSDPARQASSNYGIGPDGRIGLYVDEGDRSWCTSSRAVDRRAVTIEVSSGASYPYAVTDAAYAALLDLLTDICRRRGIAKLVWSTSKAERTARAGGCNMMVHRDYDNKSCPGEWLYSRHGAIAEAVNARLADGEETAAKEVTHEVTVRTLRRGCTGGDVSALQACLWGRGCYAEKPDGDFGQKTQAAVLAFQKSAFPKAPSEWDGIAGPKTIAKLWER